jgi:hypothetical protein
MASAAAAERFQTRNSMARKLQALIAELDRLDAVALTQLIFAAEECYARKLDQARKALSAETATTARKRRKLVDAA